MLPSNPSAAAQPSRPSTTPPPKTLRQRVRHIVSLIFFTVGAHFYAWMTWTAIWRQHCASLAQHFPPQGPDGDRLRVLDLGIGPGISGIGILDVRPRAWVVGLDFSRTMLRLAQRYLRRAGCTLDLVHGDVMRLPFPDASFDVITHHSFLYLLSQQEQALSEMSRVLRPDGVYVFLEPGRGGSLWNLLRGQGLFRFKLSMFLWRVVSRGFGRFEHDALRALLSSHGFVDIQLDRTLSGMGFLGRARRSPSRETGSAKPSEA